MAAGRRTGVASGIAVAGIACAVYAWSVIGAFAQANAPGFAFATAYQYSAGHVSGAGSILGKSVDFEFDVKADTKGIKGHCKVKEDKAHRVECLTITSLAIVGTHASFSGTAEHNRVETTFTIDVDDLGKPGKGRDHFALTTGTGFSRSGILTSGDVQIHEKTPPPSHGAVIAWCSSGFVDAGQCDVPAAAESGVAAVAAGLFHSLALRKDGRVVAWGCGASRDSGQCSVPAAASADVIAISAGSFHSLALKRNGIIVAWGCGGFINWGQCTIPAAATSGVTAIAAGYYHSAAVTEDGSAVAWGCGIENVGQCTVPPAATSGVTSVAAGLYQTLAVKNGGVVAWGCAGPSVIPPQPWDVGQCSVPPAAQSGVVSVAAGFFHSLALKRDGTVVTWGCGSVTLPIGVFSFDKGQCTVPATIQGKVTAIGAGQDDSVALTRDGRVVQWGCYGICTAPAAASSGVAAVAAGTTHVLAVLK